MLPKKYLLAFILSLAFGLLIVGVVSAQQQQPTPSDDQVNAIAKQLYCPVCENTPLDVCPTTACAQWRDLIRQKLAEGKTAQEIKDFFVQQYGARVLGAPPAKGFNVLAYLVYPVVIIAGLYLLYRAYASWKHSAPVMSNIPPSSPAQQNPVIDEYVRKLEDEVRKD